MAMVPPNPYDQLTNINRGMPQVAQPTTTTQMQPSPPSLRGFMNQHHGHFGGGNFGMLPPGIDPRAIAANPQGYQQFLRQAQQQEQQHPGATFLGQAPQPGMMPGMMPKSAGTGLDMFSNDQEKAKAAQYAAMMQYQQMQKADGQKPGMTQPVQQNSSMGTFGLNQQDLQQKLLSEQQLYSPAQYGGPLNEPNLAMPFYQTQQPQLNDVQKQYQAAGGTGTGFGQPTSVAMPTQNQYAQGKSSLSAAPQFGAGPTQSSLNQPLQSNNLMQQLGMK